MTMAKEDCGSTAFLLAPRLPRRPLASVHVLQCLQLLAIGCWTIYMQICVFHHVTVLVQSGFPNWVPASAGSKYANLANAVQ